MMIQLQDSDANIRKIKENIVENKNTFKYFVIKNDVVCRQYTITSKSTFLMGVYILDCILYAVMIFVHKFSNHPSLTQTFLQFCNLYYHPRAKKAAQNVCKACIRCTQTCNVVNKDSTVGCTRSLQPKKPREAISIDILYFLKSSCSHTHGLLVVDLFSLYMSFYPLKSKSSTAVSEGLRVYISQFCAPKHMYCE